MSNMNDFTMWLDDQGIATWDNELGELIIPEGIDIYEYVEDFKQDAKWHEGIGDDDDKIEDDPEDDFLDDDELGDIQLKLDTIADLVDMVFSDVPVANQFRDLIDTDMLTRLWEISTDIKDMNEEADEMGWSPSEYWFNEEGGLTADAENYLHELDARGELV